MAPVTFGKPPAAADDERVRRLRRRLELTQGQLAERLGVTLLTVHRWETGKSRPQRLARQRLRELEEEALAARTVGPSAAAPDTCPELLPPLDFAATRMPCPRWPRPSAGPRAPVQPGFRHRNLAHRSAAAPAHRGLRTDAPAAAAALPAGRRRRRRQDHHDGPLRPRDALAGPYPPRADRPAGRPRRQLGTRAAHPVPPAFPHRRRRGPAGRESLPAPGQRPRHRVARHARRRAHVRRVAGGRRAAVRPRRLRRGAQAQRRHAAARRPQAAALPACRSAGRLRRSHEPVRRPRLVGPPPAPADGDAAHGPGRAVPSPVAAARPACLRQRRGGAAPAAAGPRPLLHPPHQGGDGRPGRCAALPAPRLRHVQLRPEPRSRRRAGALRTRPRPTCAAATTAPSTTVRRSASPWACSSAGSPAPTWRCCAPSSAGWRSSNGPSPTCSPGGSARPTCTAASAGWTASMARTTRCARRRRRRARRGRGRAARGLRGCGARARWRRTCSTSCSARSTRSRATSGHGREEVLEDPRYAGEKWLIFTEHRDTADYLVRRLEGLGFAGRVGQIHGGLDWPAREQQVERFRRPDGTRLLVATDAAGEGINLQFCRLMVNYDIPWNPARLEQRMGRIHRYGQQHDVRIVNLVAGSTHEGRVLQVLLEKLEAIRQALRSDKVFDVIGRLFRNTPLRDYLAEALTDEGERRVVDRVTRTLAGDPVGAVRSAEDPRLRSAGRRLPAPRRAPRRHGTRALPPAPPRLRCGASSKRAPRCSTWKFGGTSTMSSPSHRAAPARSTRCCRRSNAIRRPHARGCASGGRQRTIPASGCTRASRYSTHWRRRSGAPSRATPCAAPSSPTRRQTSRTVSTWRWPPWSRRRTTALPAAGAASAAP